MKFNPSSVEYSPNDPAAQVAISLQQQNDALSQFFDENVPLTNEVTFTKDDFMTISSSSTGIFVFDVSTMFDSVQDASKIDSNFAHVNFIGTPLKKSNGNIVFIGYRGYRNVSTGVYVEDGASKGYIAEFYPNGQICNDVSYGTGFSSPEYPFVTAGVVQNYYNPSQFTKWFIDTSDNIIGNLNTGITYRGYGNRSLFRITSDGSYDTSFVGDISVGKYARDIVQDSSGNYIIIGEFNIKGSNQITKLNKTTGVVMTDASFGKGFTGDGVYTVSQTLKIDTSDNLYIAGPTHYKDVSIFGVVKINKSGDIVKNYGLDLPLIIDTNAYYVLKLDSKNRLYITKSSGTGSYDIYIKRTMPDGTIDASFSDINISGAFKQSLSDIYEFPNGNIAITGNFSLVNKKPKFNIAFFDEYGNDIDVPIHSSLPLKFEKFNDEKVMAYPGIRGYALINTHNINDAGFDFKGGNYGLYLNKNPQKLLLSMPDTSNYIIDFQKGYVKTNYVTKSLASYMITNGAYGNYVTNCSSLEDNVYSFTTMTVNPQYPVYSRVLTHMEPDNDYDGKITVKVRYSHESY